MQFSVVIPARNEAEGLRKLLPEVIKLLPGAEIIVVDDGSDDDTPSVCASAGIRHIRQPYPKGNGVRFLPISAGFFLIGLGYYLLTYLTEGRFTNMSALLLISAVFTFLIGIVPEQISALHFKDIDVKDADD